MKRILYSLLVATLPFGSVLADAAKSKDANVTLVYQHELPNVPGKSIKGVLLEYGLDLPRFHLNPAYGVYWMLRLKRGMTPAYDPHPHCIAKQYNLRLVDVVTESAYKRITSRTVSSLAGKPCRVFHLRQRQRGPPECRHFLGVPLANAPSS